MPVWAARRLVHLSYRSPSPDVFPLSCVHICFPNLERGLEETNIWVRVNSPSVWACAHKNECVRGHTAVLTVWTRGCQTISSIPHGCVCTKMCRTVSSKNAFEWTNTILMRGRFKKWRQTHFNLPCCVTGVLTKCCFLSFCFEFLCEAGFFPSLLSPTSSWTHYNMTEVYAAPCWTDTVIYMSCWLDRANALY